MSYGFLVDANNCIGCRTCEVACKDASSYELGIGFRKVASFATGSFPDVALYHVSYVPKVAVESPKAGGTHVCDYCASIREQGEQCPCVAACPMRAIEWGDLDELKAAHAGKQLSCTFPAIDALSDVRADQYFIVKPCMENADFDCMVM